MDTQYVEVMVRNSGVNNVQRRISDFQVGKEQVEADVLEVPRWWLL